MVMNKNKIFRTVLILLAVIGVIALMRGFQGQVRRAKLG